MNICWSLITHEDALEKLAPGFQTWHLLKPQELNNADITCCSCLSRSHAADLAPRRAAELLSKGVGPYDRWAVVRL